VARSSLNFKHLHDTKNRLNLYSWGRLCMFQKTGKRVLKSFLAKRNQVVVSTIKDLGRPRHLDVLRGEYTNEYLRLSQLDLAIHEIKEHNIPGDIAEVGVYKGAFSAVLNHALPDRTLYLFDTFEGFNTDEEQKDREVYGTPAQRDFSDTSIEFVLKQMPHPAQCVPRKGLFPATAEGLEQSQFCFVSLDADLYAPIKAGLEFFFERLAPGGFIFVHDYNYAEFPGAKAAVLDFWRTRGVPFVPVTDVYGTAIFRK
jgi:O-methyltransferase